MMAVLASVAERSMLAFGVILFASQMLAQEVGCWLGQRNRDRHKGPETVGVVVGGMLGLLAFVLALTLSFANARFSERRVGALTEANAIGTAWLRAKAVGSPRSEEIARLLEDYTRVRLEFVQGGRDQAAISQLNQRTSALQTEIWGHVSAIVREQPNPVTNALMMSLNDTFDASTSERFAYRMTLPPQLFWLLIGMTLVSMACLGFQFGLREKSPRVLVALLTLMWTAIIVDILDLASSRIGNLRTGTAVYEWTIQGFRGGIPIPPPPSSK